MIKLINKKSFLSSDLVNVTHVTPRLYKASLLIISLMLSSPASHADLISNLPQIDRPSWLPELPKDANFGFTTNTTKFNELKKRLIEQKDRTALKPLKQLADSGFSQAITLFGYIYDNEPKLVKLNPTIAAHYWAASARMNDPVAMYNLGVLYLYGRGVPQTTDTAFRLFDLASQQTMGKANYMLGKMYEVKKDYQGAIQAYEGCFNYQTIPKCKTRYGILSIKTKAAKDIEINKVMAGLDDASSRGDPEAMYTLARLHAEGLLLSKSMENMVASLEPLRISPDPYWRKVAADMYRAYNPSPDAIKKGRDNYRVSHIGGVVQGLLQSSVDDRRTVLEKGDLFT